MPESILETISQEIINAVSAGGQAVVNIDDGTRLTASGSIWTSDGVIVATSHGVEQDEGLTVTFHDGNQLEATVNGRDPESDIAVLKVEAQGLPSFAESARRDVSIGSLAIALARAGGPELQSSFGMVGSATEVSLPSGKDKLYHPAATLYPGFSGGALVDTSGKFIGLLNLSYGRGRGVAVGAGVVQEIVDAILAHGSVQRGYLGIATQPANLGKNLREALGRDEEEGLLVVSVETDSPAEKGGLLVGDTILTLDGQVIGDPGDLRRALRSKRSGDVAQLEIVRGGKLLNLPVSLGIRQERNDEGEETGERRHRYRGRWRCG